VRAGARLIACALVGGQAMALALAGVRPATAAEQHILVASLAGAPMQDAIVYAIPSTGPSQVPTRPKAVIDQVHRRFVPRDSVVEVGTAVEFPNSDNIRHSVYSFSPAKRFSLKLYAGRPAQPIVFDKPGVVVLGCDIHDSMVGWLLVVATPYFGRTDAHGVATLDLPPGDYALHAWHEPMRDATPARPLHVEGGSEPRTVEVRIDLADAAGGRPGGESTAASAMMPRAPPRAPP
jgi:plastocyanin